MSYGDDAGSGSIWAPREKLKMKNRVSSESSLSHGPARIMRSNWWQIPHLTTLSANERREYQ